MAPLDARERRPRSGDESGHLVLLVMMAVTVGAIMLTAAVRQWSAIERREREEELMFRGNQYVKAIKLYQLEHGGALPTSLEQLYEPGPRRLRYIRKLFRDPMAPDGKWGILLADPSGRGYINPNAPPPEQGVEGLDDLGKGFHFTSSFSLDSKSKSTPQRGHSRRSLAPEPGSAFPNPGGAERPEDDKSVTAPGQPPGPIVGVISLYDQSSFRLYKDKDNYADWAFHIFDVPGGENKQQPPNDPTPNAFGVGPGGSQVIYGGDTTLGGGGRGRQKPGGRP